MVNNWLPEPPNGLQQCDEIQANDNIVAPGGLDTSDTDDEDVMAYDGYEPLPLGLTEDENGHDSSDEESDINTTPTNVESLPEIIPIEHTLIQEVWNGPPPQFVDIEMDSTTANEVKNAMANFTLPTTNFPEWAVNIPEDQWKDQLLSRIQNLKETKK